MAITEAELAYIKALQEQKKLITTLSSSGPSIPGLSVEDVAKKLAELDTNLQETIKYYNDLADREAAKEEQEKADAGIKETDEEKRARRKKKRDEAFKKGEEMIAKYIEAQRDFIQEQIAIIEVNAGIITKEVATIPKTITLAGITAAQPTAVGAAVPNYLYNAGILFQNLSSIGRSLGTIKTAFLNMLIAADKIKFALPTEITGLLQKILNIEQTLEAKKPKESEFDQPPPGIQVTLSDGEYRLSSADGYAIVTADNIGGAPKNSPGRIVENLTDGDGNTTGIRIELVPSIP